MFSASQIRASELLSPCNSAPAQIHGVFLVVDE